MAIEILTWARNVGNALNGVYNKGFAVVAQQQGWRWGGAEGLPDFVKITVSDADTEADVTKVMQQWMRKTTYTILEMDATVDFFHVKIHTDETQSTANPAAVVTAHEMQDFLTNWGATDISEGAPGALFKITAFNAIKSKGLFTFGAEDDYVKYTELSYDPTTGAHKVQIDYSLSTMKEAEVRNALRPAQVTIDSIDDATSICVITAIREDMIKVLERQVAEKFDKMLARVRFRFSDALIDTAIANGGSTNITLAQIDDHTVDVATEV